MRAQRKGVARSLVKGGTHRNDFAKLRSMSSYASDVFVIDRYGSVFSTMSDAAHGDVQMQRSAQTLKMHATIEGPVLGCWYPENRFYLVDTDGELLFVVSGPIYGGRPVVYRVDTQNRVL